MAVNYSQGLRSAERRSNQERHSPGITADRAAFSAKNPGLSGQPSGSAYLSNRQAEQNAQGIHLGPKAAPEMNTAVNFNAPLSGYALYNQNKAGMSSGGSQGRGLMAGSGRRDTGYGQSIANARATRQSLLSQQEGRQENYKQGITNEGNLAYGQQQGEFGMAREKLSGENQLANTSLAGKQHKELTMFQEDRADQRSQQQGEAEAALKRAEWNQPKAEYNKETGSWDIFYPEDQSAARSMTPGQREAAIQKAEEGWTSREEAEKTVPGTYQRGKGVQPQEQLAPEAEADLLQRLGIGQQAPPQAQQPSRPVIVGQQGQQQNVSASLSGGVEPAPQPEAIPQAPVVEAAPQSPQKKGKKKEGWINIGQEPRNPFAAPELPPGPTAYERLSGVGNYFNKIARGR